MLERDNHLLVFFTHTFNPYPRPEKNTLSKGSTHLRPLTRLATRYRELNQPSHVTLTVAK